MRFCVCLFDYYDCMLCVCVCVCVHVSSLLLFRFPFFRAHKLHKFRGGMVLVARANADMFFTAKIYNNYLRISLVKLIDAR